jgi:tetratricopeptide (TPR) repeat protein
MRGRGRTVRLVAALVAGMLLVALLAGCTVDDKQLATEFMTEYFTRKIDPSQNGLAALGNLAGAITGKGGDPEVNAALAAKSVVDDIAKADGLASEAEVHRQGGRYEQALAKIDEAISVRPGDATYRAKRTAILAEMDRVQQAIDTPPLRLSLEESIRLRLYLAETVIEEFERAQRNVQGSGSDEQLGYIYQQLAIAWRIKADYLERRDLPDSEYARGQARQYRERAARYGYDDTY